MAKLERLPAQYIIDGFRGTLDFYVSRGQIIVRTWPRGKSAPQTPEEIAVQPLFTRASRIKRFYSATVAFAARRYTLGGTLTWADVQTRAYYGKEDPGGVPLPAAPYG